MLNIIVICGNLHFVYSIFPGASQPNGMYQWSRVATKAVVSQQYKTVNLFKTLILSRR